MVVIIPLCTPFCSMCYLDSLKVEGLDSMLQQPSPLVFSVSESKPHELSWLPAMFIILLLLWQNSEATVTNVIFREKLSQFEVNNNHLRYLFCF